MHLEGLTPDEILKVNIGTGQPLVYELDDHLAGEVRTATSTPKPPPRPRQAVAKQAG